MSNDVEEEYIFVWVLFRIIDGSSTWNENCTGVLLLLGIFLPSFLALSFNSMASLIVKLLIFLRVPCLRPRLVFGLLRMQRRLFFFFFIFFSCIIFLYL